jgi:NADPH:quinone reductase-like Zn-dependent oxidoreductase
MPSNASFEEAAALPLAVITTYQVFNRYATLPTCECYPMTMAPASTGSEETFALQQNHDTLLQQKRHRFRLRS